MQQPVFSMTDFQIHTFLSATEFTIPWWTIIQHGFYKHGIFLAELGKEIEITACKLTVMCLKY